MPHVRPRPLRQTPHHAHVTPPAPPIQPAPISKLKQGYVLPHHNTTSLGPACTSLSHPQDNTPHQPAPVDANVEVGAEHQGHRGRGQEPVVGQHAAVVAQSLQAVELPPRAQQVARHGDGLGRVEGRHGPLDGPRVEAQGPALRRTAHVGGVGEVGGLVLAVPLVQAVVPFTPQLLVPDHGLDAQLQQQEQEYRAAHVRGTVQAT